MEGLEDEVARQAHWLGWRCIPNVFAPGAALGHPTTFPQGAVIGSARTRSGTIASKALSRRQAATQTHITAAPAGMPVLEVSAACVTRGESIRLGDKARELW